MGELVTPARRELAIAIRMAAGTADRFEGAVPEGWIDADGSNLDAIIPHVADNLCPSLEAHGLEHLNFASKGCQRSIVGSSMHAIRQWS